MVRLDIHSFGIRSCIVSPTSYKERVVFSKVKLPKNRAKAKLYQMEFFGAISISNMVSGGSGVAG